MACKIIPVREHNTSQVSYSRNHLQACLTPGQELYFTFQSKTRCHVYAVIEGGLDDITPHVARVLDLVQYDVSIRILRTPQDQIIHNIAADLGDELGFRKSFTEVSIE